MAAVNEAQRAGWRLGYRPALDGVRAAAILEVLAYHSGTQVKGGFIGVDIFFVLSGFLITTLLIQEWSRSGAIDLRDFYKRRARRLLPALVVTVVAVGLIYAVEPHLNNGLSYPTAATVVIFYAGNWVAAFAKNPVQVLALLDHTWSLAIEEQFYIVWPVLVFVALRRRWQLHRLLLLAAALASASATLRAVLWLTHARSHIYFRTDTRADGLLLGCALAAALGTTTGRAVVNRYLGRVALPLIAAAALLAFSLRFGPNDRFIYLGGLAGVAVCAAAIVAHVVVADRSWLTRVLQLPPLVWIGARSYGMYLFHIPIFTVILNSRFGDKSARIVIPTQIALTMLAAAISYRWVESRFLRRSRLRGAPPHVQRAPRDQQPA